MKNTIFLKKATQAISTARSINYAAQGTLLPLIEKALGQGRKKPFQEFSNSLKIALPKVQKLIEVDSENIAQKEYPINVLFEETPIEHYLRLPVLLQDAIRAHQQRKNKDSNQFSKTDPSFLDTMPEYYKRNFHFQDGGYLSDDSARLYDHQVEILFSGTAQMMRRQIIPSLKKHFQKSDGKSLRFLEIGSGTGSLTKAVALAFPNAQIVSLDPSPYYLKYAQQRLHSFKRIDFIQGFGEKLEFKDEVFDAVFSCFLFHELPMDVRKEVISESFRVLKPNGYFGFADSIQSEDDVDMDWALKKFPIDFHEPFYKNYIENKMEILIKKVFNQELKTEIHFLTKIIFTKK